MGTAAVRGRERDWQDLDNLYQYLLHVTYLLRIDGDLITKTISTHGQHGLQRNSIGAFFRRQRKYPMQYSN